MEENDSLLPVNIAIADRTYRLKVKPEDEEVLRKTVKIINEKIVEYKTLFAGKDMQDYVAMVLLWFATQPPGEHKSGPLESELAENLLKLEQQLDNAL